MEKLNVHLERLESGELNKRNTDERKGVSSEALFDFVNIDHYVMPTLHLMIGIINYLYQKMVELHLLFVHLLIFMERVQGFGDLGEDDGEQAHQGEERNDSRVGAVVNLAKKERTKSQFKAMKKSAMVKETISDLKQKSKRNSIIDGPSQAENNERERKRPREEQRDELLLRPLLDGTRIFLSDKKDGI